jgi:hypothetical protein
MFGDTSDIATGLRFDLVFDGFFSSLIIGLTIEILKFSGTLLLSFQSFC